jgi:SP family myo-inositol transporter-like MFS transporter 13
MLGLAVVPSLIMFVGFMFLPESPRWLVFQNKEEKAFAVLCKLRHPSKVHAELITIIDDYKAYNQQRLGCKSFVVKFVTSRSLLLALSIGCGLQMFQQLCGINTVM